MMTVWTTITQTTMRTSHVHGLYQYDRFQEEQGHRQVAKEHHKAVEQWLSMVPCGVSGV